MIIMDFLKLNLINIFSGNKIYINNKNNEINPPFKFKPIVFCTNSSAANRCNWPYLFSLSFMAKINN